MFTKLAKIMGYKLRIIGMIFFSILVGYCLYIYLCRYVEYYKKFPLFPLVAIVIFSGISIFSYYIIHKRYKNSPFLKSIELIVEVIISIISCAIITWYFWKSLP